MYKNFFKRLIDITVSFLGLLVLFPLFILLVIMLFFINNGKPFFFQERPGKNEKIFKIIKFKTMNDKKDKEGGLLPNEQRITGVGNFLRKTSIDELPQIINIIKGDMAIVGPRPLTIRYLDLYNSEQKKRHLVKPGITGWAQVNGRNNISWTKKFELDVWYTDNISFLLDLRIIYLTVIKVIKNADINSPDGKIGSVSFNGFN